MPNRPTFNNVDLSERPFLVFWEVTRACVLACTHCRATAQPRPHPQELTYKEACRLIDDLARLAPPMLVLTGGDPMMRADILELSRYASQQGLNVALSPAATPRLLQTDFAQFKQSGISSISLSLDGATQATHDAFRGVPHTFARTMRAIEMAQAARLHLQINTTITKSTIPEFAAFVELMKKVRPAMWSVFLLVPTGRAAMDELPAADDVEEIWLRLAQVASEVDFGIKTTEGHHFRRVTLQLAKQNKIAPPRRAIPTRDGKGVMFVSHTGDIQPSGFLPITAGNVRIDDVGDIYRNHQLFKQLRDDNALLGKCGTCEYRTVCGGSRSRAYALTGNAFAEDPLCPYNMR